MYASNLLSHQSRFRFYRLMIVSFFNFPLTPVTSSPDLLLRIRVLRISSLFEEREKENI